MTLQARLQTALGTAYTIERELGGGGMSRVFVALETDLGRKVVVKVLPPEMSAGVNADRFRREIQLAASLQHPHIVPLLHAGRADDLVWYTMPLVEGESLRAKLAREGELPIPEAVRILRDVADALEYAHTHGVVHRDIKPDNVLISGHHAVVTDFGVAKAVSESTGEGRSSLTSLGVALGTPAYMAPEQAAADPHVDHRADLYALGALGYEVLTGRPPFTGMNPQQVLAAQVTQAPDAVTQHRATVPAGLAALIMRCLEKKPADRWQTASEIHHQLESMATPSGGMAPTEAVPAVRRPLNWKLIAGLAAVVLIAGFFGLRAMRSGGSRALDANVVAVLPFRVAGADPSLHYLREGMIDLLAAKLTGEGGPRAADPRTVTSAFRRAAGDETKDLSQDEAVGVARGIGAGQALLGGIVGSPSHITLSATLVSVPGGDTRAQATVEGPADSLPDLVDRLAAQLLVRGAGVGEATLTTRSLPAIQAYLGGQRAYRRGAYDSAAAHFIRALQADSTFALAAFGLVVAQGWGVPVPDMPRYRRLAWDGRDRLSNRDRMLLEAYVGAHYPAVPDESELLAARERVVTVVPDQADAWYFLGDKYFHQGRLLGYTDWMARAQAAFERAVALDSTFAGPLAHLVDLADQRDDTAAARRFGDLYLANEEARGGRYDLVVYYSLATTPRNPARLRQFWVDYDTASNRPPYLPAKTLGEGGDQRDVDSMLAILARRSSSQNEHAARLTMRWLVELNRGRAVASQAARDSARRLTGEDLGNIGAANEVSDALFLEGDTARAAAATRRLAPLVDGPAVDPKTDNGTQQFATCMVEQWRIAHGQFASLARSVARMRAAGQGREVVGQLRSATCALYLEALGAATQRRPDALTLAERLDSVMRQGVNMEVNLPLAQLFEALGKPDRALAAVRRGGWFGGESNKAVWLRLEGHLAAVTGDRAGAIGAYERYLNLRRNPEPSVKPEVDAVKAELARLVGERN